MLRKAPKIFKLNAPLIQRELIISCAKVTTKATIKDLGRDYFAILIDQSSDVSYKEQMSMCLRYVDKHGDVVVRFLGVLHVTVLPL